MDPIAIITGVVDLFGVARQIQGLVEKYKNAPQAVHEIIAECNWTRGLCLNLKEQVSQTDALKNPSKNSIEYTMRQLFDTCMENMEKTLKDLDKEVSKVQSKSNSRMGKWDKTKFLWKQEIFSDAAQSVQAQKANLGIIMQALQARTGNKVEEDVNNVQKGVDNIEGMLKLILDQLLKSQIAASKSTPQLGLQPPPELKKSRSDTQINTTGKRFADDLFNAVRGGRLEDLEPILAQGASVNIALGDRGDRAVHVAAREGFLLVLDRLIASGADVNVQNTAQDTALHQALNRRQIPTSLALLSSGARWKIKNANGTTVLHTAVRNSAYLVVQYLLDKGADPNARDKWGQTPLFKACHPADKDGKKANVDLKTIRLLVERGADPTLGAWKNGSTPIHELASSGHAKELEIMAKAAKTLELPLSGDAQGRTPLLIAVRNKHSDAIDVLIKYKANVNARETSKDNTVPTALWHAAWNPDLSIATKLLEAGADPNAKGNDITILHLAATQHWLELAKLLVKYKADLNAKSSSKDTPLHAAVWAKDFPITRLMLENGAKVEARGSSKATPIMAAAQIGSLPMVRLLLKHEAQWSYTTPQGTNAFIWALSGGSAVCASFFLGCGHDLDQKADGDYTALHYAARTGKMECVKLLLELGIDKQVMPTKMRVPFKVKGTAAEVARAHGAVEVAEFIERYRGE
ncbi:ankyrin repeat-containing domain protein [Colletotrichum phormii]|uniref:Ankyrin repeat-containing domain protein n=1 Tax=Colletotrichum phormii TaxID=359342 RepID=A0AAI9ZRH7_9PEZI|nr:ankyrin repeat-containing domain protein [Colletotrichum phormii]KAK1636510.1 ankyrin repeat-containing domain protein [Colletotrichum phormii]